MIAQPPRFIRSRSVPVKGQDVILFARRAHPGIAESYRHFLPVPLVLALVGCIPVSFYYLPLATLSSISRESPALPFCGSVICFMTCGKV